jgi:hypothetical protein
MKNHLKKTGECEREFEDMNLNNSEHLDFLFHYIDLLVEIEMKLIVE